MFNVKSTMENARDLQVFKNNEFGNVRTSMDENNEIWFCLKDVCDCLDISNSRMVKDSLSPKGCKIIDVNNTLGTTEGNGNSVSNTDGNGTFQKGNPNMTFIDEGNLYQVIFQSRKPNAGKFKEWVCYEVLPSIRKHGAYMTQDLLNDMLTNPDTLITLLTNLKEERAKRQTAESLNETNKPKVVYADRCLAATNGMTVGQFSKILQKNGYDTGERRLFQWLRDNKYIYRKGKNNLPYQKWMKKGYFEVKKSVYTCKDEEKTTLTPMITEKGQMFLLELMLGQAA